MTDAVTPPVVGTQPITQPVVETTPPAVAAATPPVVETPPVVDPAVPVVAAGAPEKYEFKLPEGMTLEAAKLEKVEALAREFNLTNEQAQKLVDTGLEQGKALTDTLEETKTKAIEKWETDARADAEIGGDKFDASLAASKGAMDKFATPEFVAFLNQTGLGSHPEMIRVFNKISQVIADDTPIPGGRQPEKKSGALALYDHPTSQHS